MAEASGSQDRGTRLCSIGAERTYFVLNGTSASNKIVLSALIAEGDLVLFDRNNHKAAHRGALLLSGGIPIYLPTDRNAHGLIGRFTRKRSRRAPFGQRSEGIHSSRIPTPGGAKGRFARR